MKWNIKQPLGVEPAEQSGAFDSSQATLVVFIADSSGSSSSPDILLLVDVVDFIGVIIGVGACFRFAAPPTAMGALDIFARSGTAHTARF